MQLSEKKKLFLDFLQHFLKYISIFERFKQKDGSRRFCIYEMMDFEIVVREMPKKFRFRRLFH